MTGVIIASFALQTDEIVVDELRGRNHFVAVTLIREKGTYGTVTVNFQVRGTWNIHEATTAKPLNFTVFRKLIFSSWKMVSLVCPSKLDVIVIILKLYRQHV